MKRICSRSSWRASNAQSSWTPGSPNITSTPSARSDWTSACPPVISVMLCLQPLEGRPQALRRLVHRRHRRGTECDSNESVVIAAQEEVVSRHTKEALLGGELDHPARR